MPNFHDCAEVYDLHDGNKNNYAYLLDYDINTSSSAYLSCLTLYLRGQLHVRTDLLSLVVLII